MKCEDFNIIQKRNNDVKYIILNNDNTKIITNKNHIK